MSKGIDQVRKAIMDRRKSRQNSIQRKPAKKSLLSFPKEEEKHGYLPTFFDQPWINSKQKDKGTVRFNRLIIKSIIALFVFIGTHVLLQTNHSAFQKPQQLALNALTEDFPFARMYMWYQETFGIPLAFISENSDKVEKTSIDEKGTALPVHGDVTEPFDQNGKGILIEPNETANVSAWQDGVVIFAGNDRETDKTIIIQHEDKSKSIYGYLSSIDVHLYQFVPQHKNIGTITPTENNETVYFSLQRKNKYMDPSQVIQVDDVP